MKKMSFRLLVLFVMMLSASCYARDRVIKVKDLPAPARSLVKNHFKGRMIVKAEKESNLNGVSYEVTLSNGDEIRFNNKGGWMEIDCKTDAVPVSVVPNAIAVYVKKNYHNVKINKIERGRLSYEVELSNGVDVHFDKNTYEVIRTEVDD